MSSSGLKMIWIFFANFPSLLGHPEQYVVREGHSVVLDSRISPGLDELQDLMVNPGFLNFLRWLLVEVTGSSSGLVTQLVPPWRGSERLSHIIITKSQNIFSHLHELVVVFQRFGMRPSLVFLKVPYISSEFFCISISSTRCFLVCLFKRVLYCRKLLPVQEDGIVVSSIDTNSRGLINSRFAMVNVTQQLAWE
jgi:hypothetical protein